MLNIARERHVGDMDEGELGNMMNVVTCRILFMMSPHQSLQAKLIFFFLYLGKIKTIVLKMQKEPEKYTIEDLSNAITAVKHKQFTIKKASERYGVPMMTIDM